jgi:hypothetical protein
MKERSFLAGRDRSVCARLSSLQPPMPQPASHAIQAAMDVVEVQRHVLTASRTPSTQALGLCAHAPPNSTQPPTLPTVRRAIQAVTDVLAAQMLVMPATQMLTIPAVMELCVSATHSSILPQTRQHVLLAMLGVTTALEALRLAKLAGRMLSL